MLHLSKILRLKELINLISKSVINYYVKFIDLGNKFKKIEYIIMFDIGVGFITLFLLVISLIPNSFSIIPINIVKPFLGINLLVDIFQSLHYILIGISIVFIIQSFVLLLEYQKGKIAISTIAKILFYKWIILSINTSIPYLFKLDTPPIFITITLSVLFLFWYIYLQINTIK